MDLTYILTYMTDLVHVLENLSDSSIPRYSDATISSAFDQKFSNCERQETRDADVTISRMSAWRRCASFPSVRTASETISKATRKRQQAFASPPQSHETQFLRTNNDSQY